MILFFTVNSCSLSYFRDTKLIILQLQTICSALYAESATPVDAAGNPLHANVGAGHAVIAFIFLVCIHHEPWEIYLTGL